MNEARTILQINNTVLISSIHATVFINNHWPWSPQYTAHFRRHLNQTHLIMDSTDH